MLHVGHKRYKFCKWYGCAHAKIFFKTLVALNHILVVLDYRTVLSVHPSLTFWKDIAPPFTHIYTLLVFWQNLGSPPFLRGP